MAFLVFLAFATADALKTASPVPAPWEGIVVPPASTDHAIAFPMEKAVVEEGKLQELAVELCWGKDIMDSGVKCSSVNLLDGENCQQFFELSTGHYKGTEYVRCEAADDSQCMTGNGFCFHVYDKDASAEAGHYVDMTMGKKDLTAVKVAPDMIINYGEDANAKVTNAEEKSPYLLVKVNAKGAAVTKRECKKMVGTQTGNNANLGRAIRYTAFSANGCHTYETYFKLSAKTWDASEHISGAWFYDNPNKKVESIYATGDDPNADVTSVGSGGARGAQ